MAGWTDGLGYRGETALVNTINAIRMDLNEFLTVHNEISFLTDRLFHMKQLKKQRAG